MTRQTLFFPLCVLTRRRLSVCSKEDSHRWRASMSCWGVKVVVASRRIRPPTVATATPRYNYYTLDSQPWVDRQGGVKVWSEIVGQRCEHAKYYILSGDCNHSFKFESFSQIYIFALDSNLTGAQATRWPSSLFFNKTAHLATRWLEWNEAWQWACVWKEER